MKPLLIPMLCLTACAAAEPRIELSSATSFEAADLVDVAKLVPDISKDIRYAGPSNFVGTRVDGYDRDLCYLKRPAALALARAEADLRTKGYRVKVFDCYRPARAVRHFVRWAEDLQDQRTKAEFYPNLEKSQLLGEYIAPVSGHSRGATVDLTLLKCASNACTELDMGTPFDFFDVRAHTDDTRIGAEQRTNRNLLRDTLARHGFENYPAEWWHYTFKPEPTPTVIYDIPIH